MAKRIMTLCAMLLVSSLGCFKNSSATVLNVQMPIEFIIDAREQNNPRANFINIKSELRPGLKWVMLPQIAAMFNPDNLAEPVVLIDVKKAILKIVLKNPKLAEQAGISAADFADAGISGEELETLKHEAIRPEEVGLLAQIFGDIVNGDSSKGFELFCGGGMDIIKGGAKFGLGSVILIKKATIAVAKLFHDNILARPLDEHGVGQG